MTSNQPGQDGLAAIATELGYRADQEGGPMTLGWPDRWWDAHTFRCAEGHVSRRVLKSERLGRNVCLSCQGGIVLTFPEDADGPLV